MTSGESEGRCPPPPPSSLVLFADLWRCLAPSSSQSPLLKSWGTTNATLCGKETTGDAQGRTQAKGAALTGALKENAVLQSLAWKARQLRSRDGMLPDQLNLPNQLREINHLHCGLCAKSTICIPNEGHAKWVVTPEKLWRDQCKARVDDTLRYNETPSWTI